MATVMNDRDVLLLGTASRTTNPSSATILITSDNPAFHVNASNVTTPSYITFTAHLLGLTGTASFTAAGATITDNGNNTATIAYNGMSGTSATVTVSVTNNGQTYSASTSITKVSDGVQGNTGPAGNQYAIAYLYQWSSVAPAKPTGTTVYTWANGSNSTYSASDNWSVTVPSNPGTPGLSLYVAAMPISATASTTTTSVSYSSSTVQAWTTNGAQGPQGNAGTAGMQSATINVYQWAASIPTGPSGTSTYTWNGGAIGTIPSGWSATPGTSASQGMTLWAARIYLTDTATNSQTSFNWTNAAVIAVGYSGSNGAAAAAGASYVAAYCASTTATTTTTPAQTTGKTSLPVTNDGGIVGTWLSTVPALTSGQYLYQSDGIYDPTTNKITWSIPYWSSLKVGSLSAITSNLGTINAGSINIGSGQAVINSDGSSTFKNITIGSTGGSTLIGPDGSGTIQTAITNAGTTSTWIGVTGTGKPADNASSDLTLVGANVTIAGNSVTKTGGTNLVWGDAQAYSKDSFTGGAYASAVAADTSTLMMFGLNSDPTTDASYTSIDYAIYLDAGTVYASEFGNGATNSSTVANGGTYVVGDVFAVIYDGSSVKYLKNGVVFYTSVTANSKLPNLVFFLDSSFYHINAKLNGLRFGPMSSNNWASVGGANKPADNATVGADATNLAVTIGGDNLLNNTSFELQDPNTFRPYGYIVYNNAGISTSYLSVSGRLGGAAFGIRANATGATNWGLTVYLTDTQVLGGVQGGWQPNKTYTLSFKACKVNGAGLGAMTLQWNTQPSTVTAVTNPLLSTSWQTYTFRIKWGASVEGSGRLYIDHIGSVAINDEIHIDELIVQEGDVYSEWFSSSREAKLAADTANAAIANISSDNILSMGEKSQVTLDWNAAYADYQSLLAQATSLSVSSTNFSNATTALSTYLSGLSPAYNNTTTDTAIVGATWRSNWGTFYDEKQKLINALAAKAATMASGVTLSANGTLNNAGGGQVTLPGMGHNTYRVVTNGNNVTTANMPTTAGFYVNGVSSASVTLSRSYVVIVLNRSTGAIISSTAYDVIGGAASTMASALNALTADKLVVVMSYYEPQGNRLSSNLNTAMYRCGASRSVYGSANFMYMSAYVLIGIPGIGEGNGAEGYQGTVASDTNAWVDMGFSLVNGSLAGVSNNYVPRTLSDYGYLGSLTATSNNISQGTLASRPAGTAGDFYFATDTQTLYQNIAGTWIASSTSNNVTQGTLANRPTGNNGDIYFATDTSTLYQNVSGTWTASATVGATLGVNVNGTASSLSTLSPTIGTYSSSPSGGRVVISDGAIKVYDTSGAVRIKLGNLSL